MTVLVYDGSSATGTPAQTLTTTRAADGSYAAEPGAPLSEGTHTAQAEQRDTALNVGRSAARTFTVTTADITPPAVTLTMPPEARYRRDPHFQRRGGHGAGGIFRPSPSTCTPAFPRRRADPDADHSRCGRILVGRRGFASGGPIRRGPSSQTAAEISASPLRTSSRSGRAIGTTSWRTPRRLTGAWANGPGRPSTTRGSTNNGTYQNGVALGQPGVLTADTKRRCLSTASTTSSLCRTRAPSARPGVTLEAWVKRTKSGAWQNIVSKPGNGSPAAQNYALWLNTTNQPVAIFGNGSTWFSVYAPAIDTNWHHIVATYDNSAGKVYVDGILKASATSTVHLTANTQQLPIGRSTDNLRVFGGLLDEVAVYPTALASARIQAHYQTGTRLTTSHPS